MSRSRSTTSGPLAWGVTVLALAQLAACGRATPEAPPARPPNLLVVLVDTLRADRLSLYGYGRETSPSLDRFARERGVVFENAWANAGCTFPSVNSILTGRWPQLFLDRFDELGMVIPADVTTLGERLGELGYATAAVSASQIVRATPSVINERGGFDRGFERFDESCEIEPARCVTRRAVDELERLREPFFLYLHYLDPHAPYKLPGTGPRPWADASAEGVRDWALEGDIQPVVRRLYDGDQEVEFGPPEIRHLNDLYDEEVRYFDRHFGRLLAALEQRGLLDSTVIAFVADHGEELGDHGHWAHCRSHAWETVLATPFVLAVPGTGPGVRRTMVSNIDLMPTLLELAGVADPELGLDGSSLVPLLEGAERESAARRAFAVQGVRRAARDATRKVQVNLADGVPDFGEPLRGGAEPVPSTERDRAELLAELTAWMRRVETSDAAESVRDAERLEAELRALGYL